MEPFDDRYSLSESEYDLIIRDTSQSDEGDFVCQAGNMVGNRESEAARLDVQGKFAKTKHFFFRCRLFFAEAKVGRKI